MALKRLPNDVQSLLCASAQVNTYKKAVEELVYNSLDAKATSIAIRIHIEESTIQVVDNGCGITKADFDVLGQKYMTSKLVDLKTLKASPTFYGYRGEFLCYLITVAEFVKITSRYENNEDTWAKTFQNGTEKKFTKMTTRPTKGTTVDVKGFLYNLNIQKKRIDPISEKQNIKAFLEQMSLVHNNISISLRDDSKNEIIFKIHKKRDIYQTLLTLFEVEKSDIQEMQVEKNEYKVKGLIGKKDNVVDLHYVFLNGKFVQGNSKLHKFVNDRLKKTLCITDKRQWKSKVRDEQHLFNQNLPFYFIFITCPYYDYEYNDTPRNSLLEFKNWDQINKLLDKFMKFYVSDINLIEIKKPQDKPMIDEEKKVNSNQDTRNQVKEIMNKILGNNSRKLGVSQMQKGVKGKLVKRKGKLKSNKPHSQSTSMFQNDKKSRQNRTPLKEKLAKNITVAQKLNINYSELSEDPNNAVLKSEICHQDQKLITTTKNRKKQKELQKRKKVAKNKAAPTRQDNKRTDQNKALKRQKLMSRKKLLKHEDNAPSAKAVQTHVQEKYLLRRKLKPQKNNKLKYVTETDSVYRKSKIVARGVENFLRDHAIRKESAKQHVNQTNTFHKPIAKRTKYNNEIFNLAFPPKINKYIIDKNILHKIRTKNFKTTYDLVQTILLSQRDALYAQKFNNKESCSELTDFGYKRNEIPYGQYRPTNWNRRIFTKYSNDTVQYSSASKYGACNTKYTMYDAEDNIMRYSSVYKQSNINNSASYLSEKSRFFSDDNWSDAKINSKQRKSLCSLFDPLSSRLTYESHQYQQHYRHVYSEKQHSSLSTSKNENEIRFITTQSRENFITYDFGKKTNKHSKSIPNKQSKMHNTQMRKTIEESYTIEYSKSNENQYTKPQSKQIISGNDDVRQEVAVHVENKRSYNFENYLSEDLLKSIIANTYTISPHYGSNCNIDTQLQVSRYSNFDERFNTYSIHQLSSEINNKIIPQTNSEIAQDKPEVNQSDLLHKNNSQRYGNPHDNIIEPMDVCETVFNKNGTVEREFAMSFNDENLFNDSLYGYLGTMERNKEQTATHVKTTVTENVSHHFSNVLHKNPSFNDNVEDQDQNSYPDNDKVSANLTGNHNYWNATNNRADGNNFNFKSRLRFIPKGMSQIFENCRTKTMCDFNLDEDYFEDTIYDNFVNDVQANTEIYEPIIQNVEDLATKHISKFQNKVKKDNASLVFDEKSLKEAKVLGQADCKFIAVIMKNRGTDSNDAIEHLILFDQHAVHERIRLEKNLTDYVIEDKWVSVPLENIILKMSQDEILYLHNYKDKFVQLGLQWTVSNSSEVIINAIPEAILGKNPREVDKVIKAVKSLIIEEINVIKLQKGCVSLYPKAIMDLVFSEACRYAIKFGDPLSKDDCVELLNCLSDCKTPFQCAHGRPVMAVLMAIKSDMRNYKINMEGLKRFRLRKIIKPRYPICPVYSARHRLILLLQ